MGSSLSSLEPEELSVFKKLPNESLMKKIDIPERPENRVRTDKNYLIAFFVVLLVLMPFLIYTLVNSDLNRLAGYDSCGNVCGEKNAKYDEWDCTGQDFTDKKYLNSFRSSTDSIHSVHNERECVSECPVGKKPVVGQCVYDGSKSDGSAYSSLDEDLKRLGGELSTYLGAVAWRISLACVLSLVVAIVFVVLFKTATAAMVWGILVSVLVLGSVLTAVLWYKILNLESKMKQALLTLPVIVTVLVVVLFLVMVFLFKKIQLVIVLFKESTKAAFAMPLLIFTPIITFIAIALVTMVWSVVSTYLYTAGTLVELPSGFLVYQRNVVMSFTAFFNFWMTFWSIQLITGIQYMVIGGAVSNWYFSRNNLIGNPIASSASIVFRFHLGSIAFGSMVITLIALVRAAIASLINNKALKAYVDACMKGIEQFLRFLSKNSYILTAMHGKPFFKSGKRAAKIILQNAINVASINCIGDFVLAMVELLVVIVSMLITVALMQGTPDSHFVWVVYLIVFFVSLIIACIFFGIFETTIDTIFLCFCEDKLMNDGLSRPYAMSRDLMEFMENSKEVYGEKTD